MGRTKNATTEPVADFPINEETISKQMNSAAVGLTIAAQERDTTLLIGKRIGRAYVYQALTKLLTVADLNDLQNLKESKQYKGFVHIDENGNSQSVTTWADYCRLVEGRSVESVDLDLSNLKKLGGEFFDAMRNIGIGPGTMRDIRQLPDDTRQALLVAAESGNKDAFMDLAQSLISKSDKEKTALTQRVETLEKELKATKETTDRQLSNKDAMINELDAKLSRDTPTPEFLAKEALGKVSAQAVKCASSVQTSLRAEIGALFALSGEALPGEQQRQAASAALGQVLAAVREVAADFGVLADASAVIDGAAMENADIWHQVGAEYAQASGG